MTNVPIPPALRDYVSRINAIQLNFKRYMVRDSLRVGGYYTERVLITINDDGSVHCTDERFAPTEAEATLIKGEVMAMGVAWPKPVHATNASGLALNQNSIYYYFYDDEGKIIMVHERRILPDGERKFFPWTQWSDGEWRPLEPGGKLPFWRPRENNSLCIMIHEGAKAAIAADKIVKEGIVHPWKDELSRFDHWGMIGGALSPHRTDYNMLYRLKPIEVVYVCDNDKPGEAALKAVSKNYGGALKGVYFGQDFPYAWDMADPMPEHMFAHGHFIGPDLATLYKPATHATEIEIINKKKVVKLRDAFRDEWFHSITPEVYVHRDHPNHIHIDKEFNDLVRAFSDVEDTSRLLKTDDTIKSAILQYNPGKKSGKYINPQNRQLYFNTHVPSVIGPAPGDDDPWLKFMEYLIPIEADRNNAFRWIATLIAKPEIKMLYGMLCVSETQGVGKGTLGEKILAPIIGTMNTSFPSENEVVESNFNYWAAHKRLAVVHEIYAGNSSKAYNKLKSMITDKYITVSKKYQANYEIENWIHIFACSNSLRAMKLSFDDRRWFVPGITEIKKDQSYWIGLYDWLNLQGGLGIIKAWAHKFVQREGFVDRGEPAPESAAKLMMIAESRSQGETIVANMLNFMKWWWLDEKKEDAKKCFTTDRDLQELIKVALYQGRNSDRLEKPLTIRKVAKACGWFVGEHRIPSNKWGAHNFGGRMICLSAETAVLNPMDLPDQMKPLSISEHHGF